MERNSAAGLKAQHTTFVVVRHGETDFNREHRLQGQMDVELNSNGRMQAQQLAERFRAWQTSATGPEPVACAIHSSDLARAVQTAQPIADALGLQLTRTDQLRERRLGVLQGLVRGEARSKQPAAWQAMLGRLPSHMKASSSPQDAHGIESIQALKQRVIAEVERIAAANPGRTVVLVTHGGCISVMLAHAAPDMPHGAVQNGAVHVLAVRPPQWQLLDWDDHLLRGAGFAARSLSDGFGGGLEGG